jgi:O-antigen/teichoic acid export membrane protein
MVIPALFSFASIYCYTRILSPAEFGYYSLALNTMILISACGYNWLQAALPRLLPEALRQEKERKLLTTAYVAYIAVSLIIVVLTVIYAVFSNSGPMQWVIITAAIMAIARALLNINQSVHKSRLHFNRYNIVECGQALLGFVFGIICVTALGLEAKGAIAGVILGMVLLSLFDLKLMCSLKRSDYDTASLRQIAHFGLPLVFSLGIATFLSVSDRFLVEYISGPVSLGMYAAGYTVVDRILVMIFMMTALPSFPLLIHKLEHEGVEAARKQTYHNAVALLITAMPACAGLILCSQHVAYFLIGPELRAGAVQVMPYIAIASLMGGLATHYFDHSFYLAKKSNLLLLTKAVPTVLNLGLNIMLIPTYGIMGAAIANVAAYALLLVLSVIAGQRVFVVDFPYVPAVQVTLATMIMALVLYMVPFPVTVIGLLCMVITGGSVYGVAIIAFNVMELRTKLLNQF